MTDTNSNPANVWGEVWLDAQRKYFDSWLDLARQGAEAASKGLQPPSAPANPLAAGLEQWMKLMSPPAAQTNPLAAGMEQWWKQMSPSSAPENPLAAGLDQWWKLMSPTLPAESRQVSERLLDINKGYLQMGEQLWRLAQGVQGAVKAGQDWQDVAQQHFKEWQAQSNPAAGWTTLWGLPLQHWRQLSSSYSMLPGDVEKNLRGGGPLGMDTLQHTLKGILSTPALGYNRELQEDWQEWGQLWLDHLRVVQQYENILMGVGNRTYDLMFNRLAKMAQDDKPVETLRATYDLWVDCAEEAYAELAKSDEFVEIQAKLTNTLMAVKRQEQVMVEQAQSVFDLPTRSEMDTAHERIHSLRREVRQLRHRLDDCAVEDLHQKIDQLRAELRALQTQPETPAAPTAPAPRKGGRSGKTAPKED